MPWLRVFVEGEVIFVLAIMLGLSACGDDSTGPDASTTFATVVFNYSASTSTDPSVAAMHSECVQGVGVTHVHAGWRNFQSFAFTAVAPDRWQITFTDVPVGSEQRIRVSDPNTCVLNATGASTDGVSANGTLLTRVVDTPGSGIEPGLAFEVAADGSVTP